MKTNEWYLSWKPGAEGYRHDDILLAIGLQSRDRSISFKDAISWLGPPDKVSGNPEQGEVVFFFTEQSVTAGHFTVANGQLSNFGTITRTTDNAKRIDQETGEEEFFNVLDHMDDFDKWQHEL
jgi:hypothetical protein